MLVKLLLAGDLVVSHAQNTVSQCHILSQVEVSLVWDKVLAKIWARTGLWRRTLLQHSIAHVYATTKFTANCFTGEFDARAVAQGKILPRIFEIVTTSTPSHTCYDAACDAVCSATYAMEDLHVNRFV